MAFWSKLRGVTGSLFSIGLGSKLTIDASLLTADRLLKFPDSNGSNGNVLSTNGSGTLSWVAQSGGSATNVLNARVASTANISNLSAHGVIDGITLASGDVVLLKDQTTGSENGVYTSNGTALTRHSLMPAAAIIPPGLLVTVSEGTVNFDSLWMLTTNGTITVGTTAQVYKTTDGTTPGLATHGTATIDFGGGATTTSVAVTGLADVLTTTKGWCYIMADDTTGDHTAAEHRAIGLTVSFTMGNFVNGTGFTIYASASGSKTGTYKVRYAYSN